METSRTYRAVPIREPANIITVTQGTARLAKQVAPKYGFSLQDIHTLYGSVSDFLKALPAKGFTTDVKIV